MYPGAARVGPSALTVWPREELEGRGLGIPWQRSAGLFALDVKQDAGEAEKAAAAPPFPPTLSPIRILPKPAEYL